MFITREGGGKASLPSDRLAGTGFGSSCPHDDGSSDRAGIFSIGGGVPRNNTQNVAPLIEISNERLGSGYADAHVHLRLPDRSGRHALRPSFRLHVFGKWILAKNGHPARTFYGNPGGCDAGLAISYPLCDGANLAS